MKTLLKFAINMDPPINYFNDITEANADQIFQHCYKELILRLYPNGCARSINDINVMTLYGKIMAKM